MDADIDSVNIPDSEGVWLHIPSNEEIDIYPLDPVGGILSLWGPDVGITYSGAKDRQEVWDTDEWQGHIPVHRYDHIGPWRKIQ